jgi:hypothetical protein
MTQDDLQEQLEGLSPTDLTRAVFPDDSLLSVIRDTSASLKARLFACEILLNRDREKFLDAIGVVSAAGIYAGALEKEKTVDLNLWGFLTMNELGPLGQRLVSFGEPAIELLIPLLKVNKPAGLYSGSIESKEGNSDRPRVCDFAGFFIAKIRQLPFSFYRNDDELRDAEINRLIVELGE